MSKAREGHKKNAKKIPSNLDFFPLHGLKYAGRADRHNQTQYKADLERIVGQHKATGRDCKDEFQYNLTFELNGIEDLLDFSLDDVPKEQRRGSMALQNPKFNRLRNLAYDGISKKIVGYIDRIYNCQNNAELQDIIREDKDIHEMTAGFRERNKDIIPNTPFVFAKYALSAELLLLARQMSILEKPSQFRTARGRKEGLKNVDLLNPLEGQGATIPIQDKLRNLIGAKCSRSEHRREYKFKPLQEIYEHRLRVPIRSAMLQYSRLSEVDRFEEKGALPVFLQDPETREFVSKSGRKFQGNIVLSEGQCAFMRAMDPMVYPENSDLSAGQAPELGDWCTYYAGATGSGKSFAAKRSEEIFTDSGAALAQQRTPHGTPQRMLHRMASDSQSSPIKFGTASATTPPIARYHSRSLLHHPSNAPHDSQLQTSPSVQAALQAVPEHGLLPGSKEIVHLNLNSTREELDRLVNAQDLSDKLIYADEAYYYGRFFRDGRLDIHPDSTALDIEEARNRFIFDLGKKGAKVALIGASESIAKMQYELEEIEGAIRKESSVTSARGKGLNVVDSNDFIFGGITGARESAPVFLKVKNLKGSKQLNDPTQFEDDGTSRRNVRQDNDGNILSRHQSLLIMKDGKSGPSDPMKNKEFLIKTAWHLRNLCNSSELPFSTKVAIPRTGKDPDVVSISDIVEGLDSVLTPVSTSADTRGRVKSRGQGQVKEDPWTGETLEDLLFTQGVLSNREVRDKKNRCKNKDQDKERFSEIAAVSSKFQLSFPDITQVITDVCNAKMTDGRELYSALPKDPKQATATKANKLRLRRLNEMLKVRQSQCEELAYCRDELTKDRFDFSQIEESESFDIADLVEQSKQEASPSALFAVIESSLSDESVDDELPNVKTSRLEKGEKMQYILPDFEINEATCGDKGIEDVMDWGADIVIIPYKKEGTDVNCKIFGGLVRGSGAEIALESECNSDGFAAAFNAVKQTLGVRSPRIVSFFDKTNAIGGDYGKASERIAKQYIQFTQDDCMSREHDPVTWNSMMQYNRDRTNPDSVDYEALQLKVIFTRDAVDFVKKGRSDKYIKNAFKDVITQNTEVDDFNHLVGYQSCVLKAVRGRQDAANVTMKRGARGVYDLTNDVEEDMPESLEEKVDESAQGNQKDDAADLADNDVKNSMMRPGSLASAGGSEQEEFEEDAEGEEVEDEIESEGDNKTSGPQDTSIHHEEELDVLRRPHVTLRHRKYRNGQTLHLHLNEDLHDGMSRENSPFATPFNEHINAEEIYTRSGSDTGYAFLRQLFDGATPNSHGGFTPKNMPSSRDRRSPAEKVEAQNLAVDLVAEGGWELESKDRSAAGDLATKKSKSSSLWERFRRLSAPSTMPTVTELQGQKQSPEEPLRQDGNMDSWINSGQGDGYKTPQSMTPGGRSTSTSTSKNRVLSESGPSVYVKDHVVYVNPDVEGERVSGSSGRNKPGSSSENEGATVRDEVSGDKSSNRKPVVYPQYPKKRVVYLDSDAAGHDREEMSDGESSDDEKTSYSIDMIPRKLSSTYRQNNFVSPKTLDHTPSSSPANVKCDLVEVRFSRNSPNYWETVGDSDGVNGNMLRSYGYAYANQTGYMTNTVFNILVSLADEYDISKDALSKMIENYRESGVSGGKLVLGKNCNWKKNGKDIRRDCRNHGRINREFQALTKACGLYAFIDDGMPKDGLRFCDIPDSVENRFNKHYKEKPQISQDCVNKSEEQQKAITRYERQLQTANKDIEIRMEGTAQVMQVAKSRVNRVQDITEEMTNML